MEEREWSDPLPNLVPYAPHLLGGTATVALLFATVGGIPDIVLRGCGVTLLYSLIIYLALKARKKGSKVLMYTVAGLGGLLLEPLIDKVFKRGQGLFLLQAGAFWSGMLLGGALALLLFRKRILAGAGRSGRSFQNSSE